MQLMVTEEQVAWLKILASQDYDGQSEQVPDEVLDELVDMGFARRFRDGNVRLTLGGMREVQQF